MINCFLMPYAVITPFALQNYVQPLSVVYDLGAASGFHAVIFGLVLETEIRIHRKKNNSCLVDSRRICLESSTASCEVGPVLWQLPLSYSSLKDRIFGGWLVDHVGNPGMPSRLNL
jgi:hypothetical protein